MNVQLKDKEKVLNKDREKEDKLDKDKVSSSKKNTRSDDSKVEEVVANEDGYNNDSLAKKKEMEAFNKKAEEIYSKKKSINVMFNRLFFPNRNKASKDGFMIVQYICTDKKSINPDAVDENGKSLFGKNFVAKGYNLPVDPDLTFKLVGDWVVDKYGRSFQVDFFEDVVDNSRNGVIHYLSTLDGIGEVLSIRIYDKFGKDVLDILDNQPEKLLEVDGVSQSKLEKMVYSYNSRRAIRNVFIELSPLGLSSRQISTLYDRYKADTVNIIKANPFLIRSDIGFSRALYMSKHYRVPEHKILVETMLYVLETMVYSGFFNKNDGHIPVAQGSVYMPFCGVIQRVQELLEVMVTDELFERSLKHMKRRGIKFSKDSNGEYLVCYRHNEYESEVSVKNSIVKLLASKPDKIDIEKHLHEVEKKNFRLIGQQEEAVFNSLKNNFSVITGGPGTGKTTIVNFIVKVFQSAFPGKIISLLAPTGRAAKKMSESTGSPAHTIHSALGLNTIMDDVLAHQEIELDANLVIVDEASMLDIHLAAVLLSSIKKGSKVVFVGDVDQLPSVGPGSFLQDIIDSGVVPVTKLDKIYRVSDQQSNIITNANLIKHGQADLDYTDMDGDFVFIPATDMKSAQEEVVRHYLKSVDEVGIDEVCLLTPFRTNTETGVNKINPIIQDIVNPKSSSKKELSVGDKLFRVGDKVMENKNKSNVVNGDIGYIVDIVPNEEVKGEMSLVIDFGFDSGSMLNYDVDDMESLTLAYATTIHKSQGSEYEHVIINLMNQHSIMLKRNLIYTAVTRAKAKCIIIGHESAIRKSILDESMYHRNSNLKKRLQEALS